MRKVSCYLLFCLSLSTAYGQGWERFYPELTSFSLTYGIVPMPDGGALLTADDNYNQAQPHLLLKLGSHGEPEGLQNQSDFYNGFRPQCLPLENGHLVFATIKPNSALRVLTETDANLQTIWSKNIAGLYANSPQFLKAVPDGYLLAYQNGADEAPIKVSKTNLQGDLLWQKTYDFTAMGATIRYLLSFATDTEGNFFIGGVQDFPYAPVLAKFSPDGTLIYSKVYTNPNLIYGFGSLTVLQDSLVAAVSTYYIAIIDASNGNEVQYLPGSEVSKVITAQDGKLVAFSGEGEDLYVRKYEWSGALIWESKFDRPENLEFATHLWPLPDGGVLGLAAAFTGTGYTPFVLRTDANGVTFTSSLQGKVHLDTNEDCVAEGTVANRIVIASKPGDTRYATTDVNGDYKFSIDTGQYIVSVAPPNALWHPCQDSVNITIASGDTVLWNAILTTDTNCAVPTIDIDAPFLRRCFSSTYTITYGNGGNIPADTAVATIQLDPFLSLQSASLPYTDLGDNQYSFYLGNIAPLEVGTFQIEVLVSCSAELGQMHCSSASLDIANPCMPGGLNAPVIEVEATCETDSVAFNIKNVGGAAMPSPAEFVIIEDLIVMRQGPFQLPSQGSMVVKCPADGSTSRIYAGHAPGEAPFFAATTAIEGCNGPIQPGIWNMFPEMFSSENVDRDCQPNVGSFDPNDKQAVPTGYDSEHFIGRGVDLNYKIRFQNTGTDTAFNIVVLDTLSPWLQPASVRPGSASHPYTWALLGEGVLQFKFENILLPDSNTNLAASQGYVSFQIEQKPDLPLQTLIENRAAIFFDFNAPVITNTTFHTIGEKFIKVSAWEPGNAVALIQASPNPFSSETRLELKGLPDESPLRMQIFDLQGKWVGEVESPGNVLVLKKGSMQAGLYLFSIQQSGVLVGRGKLVVQD